MTLLHVVSCSTGKDSTATLLLAQELHGSDDVLGAFADTGNEHDIVYEYLDYLEQATGIKIKRLRRDFSFEIARKKRFVLERWPEMGVPAWIVERAAAALVPSGNPMLDLCLWKGRFPSRKAQFCTQFLKTEPLVEYQMDLIDEGHAVWSWQGIRADESPGRARKASFEEVGGGLYINRPILRWTASDCFDAMAARGIRPNPLYTMGMKRVGCMPCVNSSKDDLLEISKRFPEHIDRIAEWENMVGEAGKRGEKHSSFIPAPDNARGDRQGRNIRDIVKWSQTDRTGQRDLLRATLMPAACSSSYGLCE